MKKLFVMIAVMTAAVTMSANTFTKVTSAPDDWSGQYLVVYEKSATEAWIFNGKDEAQDYITATIADGKIVSDDLDQYVVTVATMEGGYSVKAGIQYMGGDASKNTIKFNAQPILNTISMDSVVYFTSATSVLRFNPTSTISNNKEAGIRFRYYKAATYTKQKGFQLYKGTAEPVITKIDTVSVTEARARIDAGNNTPCYIDGVVATAPSDPGSYGNTIMWLTDIDNPTDSLEGYKIAGLNGATIATIDDIPFALGDTIRIFASDLKIYNKSIYETEGGYFVEMLGNSNIINATNIFPFAYGAVVGEADEVGKKYHFDVVLTSEESNPDKGIHMGIVSSHEDGIAGSYTLYPDNSFVNGATATDTSWISGSVKITYVEAGEVYNKYEIVANYSLNDQIYRLDSIYEIPAITEEEWYNLDDDKPFIPKEGDTITCEQALSYAKSLGTETSPMKVYIRGWVVSNPKTSDSNMSQRNFYINDDPKASKGIAQSYYCYEQGLDSIAKGNEVLLYGNILLYGDVAEVKNGQIYRLTGTEQHKRDIQCEEAPETFIRSEEAYEIGMMLDAAPGQTVESEEEYTVVGYIAKVDYQTKNDTATWFMADDMAATYGNLQAYKCYIPALIEHGDAVMVTGKIMKYVKDDNSKTTIELKAATATFLCSIPSGLPTISVKKGDVRKMIMDGRFYILHGHNWYNAQGEIVGHE